MKKVLFQSKYQGEKVEIWETEEMDLKKAWDKIDNDVRPDDGGWVYFEGDDDFIVVNGGLCKPYIDKI